MHKRQAQDHYVGKSAEATAAMAALPPHQRIVEVAREMFCRDGIHATGIDRILAAANASKMTLYSRFGSKDTLVREVLLQEGGEWRTAFFAAVTAGGTDAPSRLRAVVPALAQWFGGGRFYGCAFMNAVAEHSKEENWLRELAAAHHKEILAFLGDLAAQAGYPDPPILARQILLLMDGAIAAMMVSGDPAVLTIAERNLAAILSAAHT
jgi:AcrR family transcriptional regulator